MNELRDTVNAAAKIRHILLATVSAVALAASGESAMAAGDSSPAIWIEGGWHFEDVTGKNDPFVPPLEASIRAAGLPSLTAIENTLGKTYGAEGSILFRPNDSDWLLIASVRYGHANSVRRVLGEKTITGPQMITAVFQSATFQNEPTTPTFSAYAEDYSRNSESHTIVDFQVGRDVGMGLFGKGTDSIISFGARYARMSAASKAHSYAAPDATFQQVNFYGKYRVLTKYHESQAFVERSDSLQAVGPSLSLKNTTGLAGNIENGQIALDWGLNASLLFGRQKAKVSHHSTVTYIQALGNTTVVYTPVPHTRSRRVTIPNVGGFMGLSYRFNNAKISAGYRADLFLGAKDNGLDTRSTTNIGFHGPFASLSIGIGD